MDQYKEKMYVEVLKAMSTADELEKMGNDKETAFYRGIENGIYLCMTIMGIEEAYEIIKGIRKENKHGK